MRGRTVEALACVDTAMIRRSVARDRLTIGTDNGTQFTSRPFRSRLVEHGIVHRRGGYRDPESQAFIESWFGRFKKRVALARRVGNDRSSKEKHRQLCERIPSAAPLRARLPDTRRGGPHLADTQQPSDLKPTTNQGSTSAMLRSDRTSRGAHTQRGYTVDWGDSSELQDIFKAEVADRAGRSR